MRDRPGRVKVGIININDSPRAIGKDIRSIVGGNISIANGSSRRVGDVDGCIQTKEALLQQIGTVAVLDYCGVL